MSTPHLHENPSVEAVIARWAPQGRAGLLPCLIEVQEITGYLSPEVCRAIARGLRIPEADVFGVVSFYSLLYDHPVGRLIVRVCDDIPCYLRGSTRVLEALQAHLGIQPGATTADGSVTLEVHPCLGRCDRAPFLLLNEEELGPVTPEEAVRAVEAKRQGS